MRSLVLLETVLAAGLSGQVLFPDSPNCLGSDNYTPKQLTEKASKEANSLARPAWSLPDAAGRAVQQRTVCLIAGLTTWNRPGQSDDELSGAVDWRTGKELKAGCRKDSKTTKSAKVEDLEADKKCCLLCAERAYNYEMPRYHNLRKAIAGVGADAKQLQTAVRDLKLDANLRGSKKTAEQLKGTAVCRMMPVLRDV